MFQKGIQRTQPVSMVALEHFKILIQPNELHTHQQREQSFTSEHILFWWQSEASCRRCHQHIARSWHTDILMVASPPFALWSSEQLAAPVSPRSKGYATLSWLPSLAHAVHRGSQVSSMRLHQRNTFLILKENESTFSPAHQEADEDLFG